MHLRKVITGTAAASLLLLAAAAPRADDTEIYFTSGSSVSGDSLVMFYVEYTPNLTSTICNLSGTDQGAVNACGNNLGTMAPYFTAADRSDQTITLFEMLRAVLKKVLSPVGNISVGLILTHDDNNKCDGPDDDDDCSNGAYILKGFTDIDTAPASFDKDNPDFTLLDANKQALFDKLDAIPQPQGSLSHPNQNKEVYFEFFRYLTGQGVHNGHNGWADYGTNTSYNIGTADDGTASVGWDTSVESGNDYIAALAANCSKVFMINVVDGGGNSANDSDTHIKASLASGGMNLNVSTNDKGFVQMVQWMHDKDLADGTINSLDLSGDQNVTSFFVARQTQQVDAAAQAGGTGYALELSDDAAALQDTIENIFNQILSVSTTFVSASIPVNVFNRSEVMDNVYIALFQANADAQPQWVGNVKKLKMTIDTYLDADGETRNRLELIDANGNTAISPTDGRIHYDALTYWTNTAGFDLYDDLSDDETDGRDGRSVHRGGAGQNIPEFLASDNSRDIHAASNSTGTRTLYTEPDSHTNGSAATLMALDADSTTAGLLWSYLYASNYNGNWDNALDVASLTGTWSTDRNLNFSATTTIESKAVSLLKFMRGIDAADEDGDGDVTEGRRWIFGDPLHSRPLPINYGARGSYSTSNPDIRLLVGSNDGYMRMIRNTDTDGSESGQEVWAFMPRDIMRIQKQLMDNAAGGDPVHPYGTDGAATAYIEDDDGTIGSGDKVWVFFGLRRGGRAYYALDVTDPDTPKLLWSIDSSTSGFGELGLTFSNPVVRLLDWGSGDKPVVIFGGGYDPDKDSGSADDNEGNAIYVVDAETGSLVWKAVQTGSSSTTTYVNAGMLDSIPSEVTAVDSDGDSLVDRIYVGDTGGVVWRADVAGTDRTTWSIHKLFSAGRHYSGASADDRRFFHPPDFVPSEDDNGAYDALIIGSGNRAHPLGTGTVDWVYMYKDRSLSGPLTADQTTDHDDLQDITADCAQETSVSCGVGYSLANGWKLQLEETGEKSLASPLTLSGVIYFSTYIPGGSSGATCGPAEGGGYLYAVSLDEGNSVFNYDTTNDVTDADGNTDELFKTDRRRELLSGGIPSENVYVSYRDENGNTFTGVLSSDLQAGDDLGAQQWETYWYLQE